MEKEFSVKNRIFHTNFGKGMVIKMRILVYGAGVIGCELAHLMNTPDNEVVLLARGEWKCTIERNGLMMKHCGYLYTSIDKLSVIDELKSDDYYDLIFVVMTYHHVKEILPFLQNNCSKNILFIGNNANPQSYEKAINTTLIHKKEVLFGFTGIGGERRNNKIISMHTPKISLLIGGLEHYPSKELQSIITTIFSDTSCQIEWEENMQGWLLTHLAFILPTTYICYHQNFHLAKTDIATMKLMIEAVKEAHIMLKESGYQIRPVNEDKSYDTDYSKKMKKLFLLFKTPAGKFVISNHCKHGVTEMIELDKQFQFLRQKSNTPMPAWDKLRNLSQPAKEQY